MPSASTNVEVTASALYTEAIVQVVSENLTISSQANSADGATQLYDVSNYKDDKNIWKLFLLLGIGVFSTLVIVYTAVKIYLCSRQCRRKTVTENPYKRLISINYLYNRAVANVRYEPIALKQESSPVTLDQRALSTRRGAVTYEENENQNSNPNRATKQKARKNKKRARLDDKRLPLGREHTDQTDVVFNGSTVRVPMVKVNLDQRRPLPPPPPTKRAFSRTKSST